MPAIPLASHVLYGTRYNTGSPHPDRFVTDRAYALEEQITVPCAEHEKGEWRFPVTITFVDLDDPQGFGYALRYACKHCDPAISYLWPAMASRWMRGDTTGTDRLALAQALAEVKS